MKKPCAVMAAILEAAAALQSVTVTAVETRYAVPGWGAGELWRSGRGVAGHELSLRCRLGRDRWRRRARRSASTRSSPATPIDFADVEIDLGWATPFQRDLAEALRAVPRGDVVSYGELAALAGRPGAAVPPGPSAPRTGFAFVVPCHRVVAATGIGGYGSAASR